MTRDTIDPEARGRGLPGAWSFHAPVAHDYAGPCVVVEAVRVGDHWHVHVSSGRARETDDVYRRRGSMHLGWAGKLILRLPEWALLRAVLDSDPRVGIYEVEHPTPGQATRYASDRKPS